MTAHSVNSEPRSHARAWRETPADSALVDRLAAETGLSRVVSRILVSRGLTHAAEVRRFLEPDLDRDRLDASVVPGMGDAAARVAQAVLAGERIVVFGDFDLDGISSAALATRGLAAMGACVEGTVPDRFREGYGLTAASVERLASMTPRLVITVDCGISSAVEVAMLRDRGIDVVVTDHHEPGDGLPTGVPVADPKLDPGCPACDLAGAGVALMLIEAVGALLGKNDVWRSLTDLATLGTVADIVPLVGANRALVLAGEGWHEGVKGIVASRLARRFGVPVIMLAIADGVARGSGRSVGSVDLYQAVSSAGEVLDRFGGHAAAVGLTLDVERIDEFRTLFTAHLAGLPAGQFVTETLVDAEIGLGSVGLDLAAELALLEPFGHSNPRPLFSASGVFMAGRERVGQTANHLRFSAYDGADSIQAISFRCPDIERYALCDAAVDLAFQIQANEWRGRKRVQMLVREIAAHEHEGYSPAAELVEDLFARADEILAREEYSGIGEADSFHTKLAGVTFEGRQDVLARLAPGTPLRVERQPENPYDSNAIALHEPHGDQVGFFNRRLAGALAPVIDAGVEYDVEVADLTGGDEGRSRGVNVLVTRRVGADDLAEEEDIAARREQLTALDAADLDRELVREFIGDGSLHDAQRAALDELTGGHRCLTVMATGRGKSLIFHLHAARTALVDGGASVFVFPLRALVADQAFHLEETMARIGVRVCTLTGESSPQVRDDTFASLAAGDTDIVLTTPEFLTHHVSRFAATGRVRFCVVDEAHHVGIARAGHRPAYLQLGSAFEELGDPAVLAVTATAGDDVADVIRETLGITATVIDPTVRANLIIEDRRGLKDKDAYLATLASRGEKMIVYVNSRDQSVRIARMLRKKAPGVAMRVAFYNGGLTRSARHAVERAFRAGELDVVIATSAFGEGVNIPDVRHVVLYHLPFNDIEFNQMCGRGGRDGAAARIHLLFGPRDAAVNDLILTSVAPSRDDLASLYRALKGLAAGDYGDGFEVTNAELAERVCAGAKSSSMNERGVSTAIGIFRELGLVTSEGHGAYRRLALVPAAAKVELDSSVRYSEGLEEIAGFGEFRAWVLGSGADDLLARINRPILPSR